MEVGSAPDFIFGDVMLVFFKLFFVSFEIFNHKVFTDEFVVIGEVINDLTVIETDA